MTKGSMGKRAAWSGALALSLGLALGQAPAASAR